MGFKNFFISIIKSLIVLLLATLIFSTITFDFPNLLKGVFGDIFSYASPDAQKQVVSKLAETCSSLEQGQINSLKLNLSDIGALCKDFKAGKINDQEFFFNVISSSFSSNQTELPKIMALEKYNQAINYLNGNKVLYFLILTILIVILYLLIINAKLFMITLSQISFSIGALIMFPYIAIIFYGKFVGFDTTPILSSLFGVGNVFDFKAITSVILLLFLRTYNDFIITTGIAFLAVGIAGKVYGFFLKRKSKVAEPKTEEKSEKEVTKKIKETKKDKKETDEEADKKDRGRKRSTKEILDELEEMHKKRTKN